MHKCDRDYAVKARILVLLASCGKFFMTVITDALYGLKTVLGGAVGMVVETIDAHIQCWVCKPFNLTQNVKI